MTNTSEINDLLEELFNNHQHEVEYVKYTRAFKVKLKNTIVVDSRVTQQSIQEEDISSRLDVKIDLPNEQSIIESFGDVAGSSEDAILKNLDNFVKTAYYPITACLDANRENPNIIFYEWEINGTVWKVFIGDLGMKVGLSQPVNLPKRLFETIEKIIKEQELTENYNWFRFFAFQMNNEIQDIEFLINNQPKNEGLEELQNLDWELRDGFYSVRNFILLKKNDIVEKPKKSFFAKLFNRG
ncbi:MAG: DUF6348 family protein [Saprospiraceae bacterium]|nr:DUF6348 family protein [Saprospiraceae bacterium]